MEGFSTAPQLSSAPVVTGIVAGTNITIDPVEGINVVTINAPGAGPGGGVLTIAGLEGVVTLSSPDDTININVDGQDIGLTSAGIITASAGTGISITGTQDITIANDGVTSLTDGTRSSTGVITLTAGTGASVMNSSGTFTIGNTGVTELTGGDGISISAQTGSITIGNTGLLSASAGAGMFISTSAGVATITNRGVTGLADLSGAIALTGGSGIGIVTSTETNTITLSNNGLLSASSGTGILVSTAAGVATISNRGVLTLADLSGAITLSATGMTITPSGQNLAFDVTAGAVSSVNALEGAILIDAGTGITITTTETPSIQVTNSLPGPVATGTIDQTGFTLDTPTGQYYKAVTVTGMTTNGLVLATANGTPAICVSAWITTLIPTTNTITIWLAANPVATGETWEAHYVVTSF